MTASTPSSGPDAAHPTKAHPTKPGHPEGENPARLGMFASLRIPNYRIFLPGQVFSMIGLWTQRIAQDYLVLTLTGSSTMVGVATAMQFVPTIVFGMPAGVVADRFNKRHVLLATVTTLGLCAATLAVLNFTGTVQLWHVLAVAFITGAAAAFDNPTRQAFVHELVGGIRLRNAVSLNAAVSQLGMMVGPALGAALMATFGIGASFACSAGTYVVVVASFLLIRRARLLESPALGRGRGHMRSALTEIGRRSDLLWPLVLAGFGGFFITNFPVSLAAFTKDFDSGAGGLGFMTSSLAVGSVIGALVSARWPGSRLRGLVALTLGIAAAQILAGLMPELISLCIALVIAGFAASPFRIGSNTAVQLAAGDAMRGRVMGVFMLLVLGTAAAGGPVVGFLDEHLGAGAGFLVGGTVMALVALFVAGRLSRVTGQPLRPEIRTEVTRIRNRLAAVTGR